MKILLLSAGLFMLASCGFQLRGSGGFNLDVNRVSVTAANRHGEFPRELERQIDLQGIEVVEPGLAEFVIQVLAEYSSRRPVATGRDITAPEYALRLTSRFKVVSRSREVIIPDTSLFATRMYRFNRDSLVASAEEESLLRQEMRRDLARQLLHRFGAALRRRGSLPTDDADNAARAPAPAAQS